MKYLSLFLLLLATAKGFSQIEEVYEPPLDSIYKTHYLDGVFETKEDFLKGRRKNFEIYPKTHRKDERYKSGVVADPGHTVRFRYKSNNKVVSKVFAVSYNGFLYFQVDAITKEINRKDRHQSGEFDYNFVRAILGGQNYIYTEYEFGDNWEQALVINAGGAGGYMLAGLLEKQKGVVWDFWKHEFNIFRQCKDFNVFISDKNSEAVQNCDEKLNVLEVRKAIDKIK